MLACLGVTEPLGQTKVNYVYEVLFLSNSDQKVVWLHISMEEVSRVNELESL